MVKSNQKLDFLAAISGLMIAFQARANGELSHRMGNPIEAALVSFGSGLLIISVISFFNPAIIIIREAETIQNFKLEIFEDLIAVITDYLYNRLI